MKMTEKALVLAECDRLEALGDFEAATALLRQAIEASPDELDYWVHRGRIRFDRLANPTGALTDFRQAIACDPESPIPHQYLSLCFLLLGDGESAFDHAERAYELDERDAFSHYVVAKCRVSVRRFHAAVKHLELAVKIDDQSSLFWSALGDAYLGAKKTRKAIKAYERANSLEPNATIHISLASIELDLGNVAEAFKHLDLAASFHLTDCEQTLIEGYRAMARRR